jgi:hypothetical protein
MSGVRDEDRAEGVPHFIVSKMTELPPKCDQGTRGCDSATVVPFSVEIPASEDVLLGGIAKDAFQACSGLTSVIFPAGVTKIGECAFWGCRSLTTLVLPNSVKLIDTAAFHSCCALSSVLFPEDVTTIEDFAFSNCISLTSLVLPERISKIGEAAFDSNPWLVVVMLRSQCPVYVLSDAFDGCEHLTLVVAPRASGLVGAELGGVTVVEDTAANRRRALDLQYWRASTHELCSPARRSWVLAVLLVAHRLRGGPFALPHEMWDSILSAIRRCELGPAPWPVDNPNSPRNMMKRAFSPGGSVSCEDFFDLLAGMGLKTYDP